MLPPPTRRDCLAVLTAAGLSAVLPRTVLAATAPIDLSGKFAAIEAGLPGRLGVSVIDSDSGKRWSHRGDERFPLCSTFKVLAAAAILARVDARTDTLERRVIIRAGDVVAHSPVTESQVGGMGMTLGELCRAAITTSDNTAGNMMLKAIGGPAGLTGYARSIGDDETRLDRWETALNEAAPGDPRDTTTPDAMARALQAVLIGSRLSMRSRKQLAEWMIANRTGGTKLRAGLPKRWRIGDKTGGGDQGTSNDIAIIWPPARQPLVVAVYLTQTTAPAEDRDAAIAEVARLVAAAVQKA